MMFLCQLSDILLRPSCSFLDEIYSNMHLQEVHDDLVAILHSSFCESALFSLCESALLSHYEPACSASFIDSYTQVAHGSHQPFFIIV